VGFRRRPVLGGGAAPKIAWTSRSRHLAEAPDEKARWRTQERIGKESGTLHRAGPLGGSIGGRVELGDNRRGGAVSGIVRLEDKIVQQAVVYVLEASTRRISAASRTVPIGARQAWGAADRLLPPVQAPRDRYATVTACGLDAIPLATTSSVEAPVPMVPGTSNCVLWTALPVATPMLEWPPVGQ
jgi:hypothetical protein